MANHHRQFRTGKGERVELSHDVGGRWKLTAYTLTDWGAGPFGGSEYGNYARLRAEYDRIVGKRVLNPSTGN